MKKWLWTITLCSMFINWYGAVFANPNGQAALCRFAMGEKYHVKHRLTEALREWRIALELDPDLQAARERIEMFEQKEVPQQEAKPDLTAKEVKEEGPRKKMLANQSIPIEKIPAPILEIEKMGGKATKIIIHAGENYQVKAGMDGLIVETNGLPLATFTIKIVSADRCMAEVVGLNKAVSDSAIAIIHRPK